VAIFVYRGADIMAQMAVPDVPQNLIGDNACAPDRLDKRLVRKLPEVWSLGVSLRPRTSAGCSNSPRL
jgi:hypothetical protein